LQQKLCLTCETAASLGAGGELQRFAIAVVAAQEADVYMIDEPSSYLDVRQRLKAAQVQATCCCCARMQTQ
jgi:translation initiation factor RLI1